MMNTDLSKQPPLLPPVPAKASKRPTPCAGLFGWRKDAPAAPCGSDPAHAIERDHPLG
ncbi:MAG: hypothetical protein J0H88_17480 [Sphingomonadales bacterium]|nr:hypothetical protein [Sphingomonadales bacterium]